MNKDSEETVLAIVIIIISIAFVFILCFSIERFGMTKTTQQTKSRCTEREFHSVLKRRKNENHHHSHHR